MVFSKRAINETNSTHCYDYKHVIPNGDDAPRM